MNCAKLKINFKDRPKEAFQMLNAKAVLPAVPSSIIKGQAKFRLRTEVFRGALRILRGAKKR